MTSLGMERFLAGDEWQFVASQLAENLAANRLLLENIERPSEFETRAEFDAFLRGQIKALHYVLELPRTQLEILNAHEERSNG
jgi:hypothetical protein